MKRTFKSIMFVAAAAMAFTACNIEPVETPEVTTGTHTVKFIASQVDTKTTMKINNGVASFAWDWNDMRSFHIFENGVGAASIDAKLDNDVMTITASFSESKAPYTYTGFMAATVSNENPAVNKEQIVLDAYDPESDILVAKPVTDKTPEDLLEGILFQFKRVVAINQMTLKGLTEGETVSEVTITSDKPIAGEYDFANGTWKASENSISIVPEAVANTDGQAVVYFVSAPVDDAQLTVTATTAAGKTYSKELAKTISFSEGGVKTFGVTVVEETPSYGYVKVTSTADLTDGKYLIVYETGDVALDGKLTSDCAANTVAVTISNGEIASTDDIDAAAVTFNAANGSFLGGGGKYIGHTGSSNTLNYSDIVLENEVSIDSDGNAVIDAGNDYVLRFNDDKGQKRFRYYKGTQKAIQLYKYNGTIEVVSVTGVSLSQSELTLEVGDFKTLEATVAPDDATNKSVTWSSSNKDVATVEDGTVTAVAAGTATITVTTVDGEFTASCDVTVNAAAVKVYSSLADLIADGEPTGKPVTVTLTDEVIESIFVSNGYRNGVFLMVPDKKVEIYCYDVPEEWEAFGTLSGTLENCTWKNYYGTWELCPEDWTELNYTAPVKYNVVISEEIEGGSVSVDMDKAPAGATVALTATPDEGYQFASWSVKDASGKDVTVTDNAFTMPASNVTVSATFKEKAVGGVETAVFDFAAQYVANGNVTSSNITVGEITFIGDKGTGTTPARSWSDGLRIYAGNTVTFSAAEGYVITSISGYTPFDFVGSLQSVSFTELSKATVKSAITVTYKAN